MTRKRVIAIVMVMMFVFSLGIGVATAPVANAGEHCACYWTCGFFCYKLGNAISGGCDPADCGDLCRCK